MFGKKKELDSDLALLATAADTYELSVIRGLLKDNDIPFLEKDRESGSYMKIYMGMSIFGTDIIVSKDNLERAKGILAVLETTEDSELQVNQDSDSNDNAEKE